MAGNGVGGKGGDGVWADGWGEEARPLDGNGWRVVARVCGIAAAENGRDVKVLRERLKCAYHEASADLAAASIAMIDIHEILRLHAQTCCGKTPDCSRCALPSCRSRRQQRTVERETVDPALWDDWRALDLGPSARRRAE